MFAYCFIRNIDFKATQSPPLPPQTTTPPPTTRRCVGNKVNNAQASPSPRRTKNNLEYFAWQAAVSRAEYSPGFSTRSDSHIAISACERDTTAAQQPQRHHQQQRGQFQAAGNKSRQGGCSTTKASSASQPGIWKYRILSNFLQHLRPRHSRRNACATYPPTTTGVNLCKKSPNIVPEGSKRNAVEPRLGVSKQEHRGVPSPAYTSFVSRTARTSPTYAGNKQDSKLAAAASLKGTKPSKLPPVTTVAKEH